MKAQTQMAISLMPMLYLIYNRLCTTYSIFCIQRSHGNTRPFSCQPAKTSNLLIPRLPRSSAALSPCPSTTDDDDAAAAAIPPSSLSIPPLPSSLRVFQILCAILGIPETPVERGGGRGGEQCVEPRGFSPGLPAHLDRTRAPHFGGGPQFHPDQVGGVSLFENSALLWPN